MGALHLDRFGDAHALHVAEIADPDGDPGVGVLTDVEAVEHQRPDRPTG